MKFWDREKEKEWLKRYLQTEPNAILFVYGPKSSGKTTLLMKVVEELPKDSFVYYWFDLRERLITGYRDVVDLFFLDEEVAKELYESSEEMQMNILSFFKVSSTKKRMIEEKKMDPFVYMSEELKRQKERPVIVFDELQKLKEVYLNGQRPLVRELFNFFVRITKVLHLAHVIVMTSDTFFIEQVYTESTLANTSRFFLVDFFDDETARKILIKEGMSEKDVSYIVEWIGGVPWMLEEVLEDNPESVIKELFEQVKSQVFESVREDEELLRLLERILRGENLYYARGKDYEMVKKLVEKEILFMDPIGKEVKFQTKLHERAAKEILEVG